MVKRPNFKPSVLKPFFVKRHPKVGARPGALVIPEAAPPSRIRMISYGSNQMHEADVAEVGQLHEAFDTKTVSWIDVQGFGDGELIRGIGDLFQFHPLLLGDVVNVPQRPKTDAYADQLLVIVRMVRIDEQEDEIVSEQVSVVLGSHYVVTFQERHGDVLDAVRNRIRSGKGLIRSQRSDYLAYAIIDTIVDAYYPVLEHIGDKLERLEHEVVANPTVELLGELNRMKSRLVALRRGIWPQREAINSLYRDEHTHVTADVRIFLRDTYDHCIQTSEVTEMYREMVTGLMNTYLSSVANRTNEVMKVLTIVSTIFIPLTFLAGIYGMNFEYMPELRARWAYPAVWVTMLVVAAVMVVFFYRKGWLGSQRRSGGF